MNFKQYLNEVESELLENPRKVADELKQNFKLMESVDDVMEMARLIVQVCGEHLGEWPRGIELLRKLKNNATIKDQSAMKRYVAILELGNNPNSSIEHFSPTDQVRIYAATALALFHLGGLKNTEKFIKRSMEITSTQLSKEDPANDELVKAVGTIARALDKKTVRNAAEDELMKVADSIGRQLQ